MNFNIPLFPGHKFGGPSFITFGRNNENARDEFVYAVSSDQWDNDRIGPAIAEGIEQDNHATVMQSRP